MLNALASVIREVIVLRNQGQTKVTLLPRSVRWIWVTSDFQSLDHPVSSVVQHTVGVISAVPITVELFF